MAATTCLAKSIIPNPALTPESVAEMPLKVHSFIRWIQFGSILRLRLGIWQNGCVHAKSLSSEGEGALDPGKIALLVFDRDGELAVRGRLDRLGEFEFQDTLRFQTESRRKVLARGDAIEIEVGN